MTDRHFRPLRGFAFPIAGRRAAPFLFVAFLVAVSLASSHREVADISSSMLSDLSGDPATAYGAAAENLTLYAPGTLFRGRAGPFCPLWLRVAGRSGPMCTKQVYGTDLPGTGFPNGDLPNIGDVAFGCSLGCMTDDTADTAKAAEIRALMAYGRFAIQDTVSAAALQAATWNVPYGPGISGHNARNEALQKSGYAGPVSHAVGDEAAQYLLVEENGKWTPSPVVEFWPFENLTENSPAFVFVPDNIQINDVAIPEPAVVAVMGGAMLLVAFLIRARAR